MIAILAGVFLWCFVLGAYAFGIELGGTTVAILLALGAVLVASYAIESIKISASGLELKTREQVASPLRLPAKLPQFDYVKAACYCVLVAFVTVAVVLSLLPPANQIRNPHDGPIYIDDPRSAAVRVTTLFNWGLLFSFVAVLTLLVKAAKQRRISVTGWAIIALFSVAVIVFIIVLGLAVWGKL